MGGLLCSEKNVYCNSEVETLIRETLDSYTPLSKHNLESFLSEVRKLQEIDATAEEKKLIYKSKSYNNFLQQLKNTDNEYEQLQSHIPPSFDEMFESHIFEKPEYNLSLFALGFLGDSNKFSVVKKIYTLTDSTPDSFTYNEFCIFLEDYLHEALVHITQRVNKYIQSTKDNLALPGPRMCNKNFKEQANKVEEFYSRKENHRVIKNDVLRELRKILGKKNTEFSVLKNMKLNEEDLAKLNSKFPSLFNVIELRHHYYTRFDYVVRNNNLNSSDVKEVVKDAVKA